MLAPRGYGFEQSCTVCRHDAEARKQWGCDEPAAEPFEWITPCFACRGADDDCPHCEGSNRVPITLCPNRTVTMAHREAIQASSLVELGILPDQGGWQDQAASFVQAFPLCMEEIEHWREVRRKLAMQKAQGKR